jgi:hypothetical protein
MSNINYGYIGLAIMIIASGITILPEDNAFKCEETGEVWVFERLSSSQTRGYYDGLNYKECSTGWKNFTNIPTPINNSCIEYSCPVNKECFCKVD